MELELKAWPGEIQHHVPKKTVVSVPTLRAASETLRAWIVENDLGGSNVGNIRLYKEGKLVAYLSYNGRAWTTQKKHEDRLPIPLDAEIAPEKVRCAECRRRKPQQDSNVCLPCAKSLQHLNGTIQGLLARAQQIQAGGK